MNVGLKVFQVVIGREKLKGLDLFSNCRDCELSSLGFNEALQEANYAIGPMSIRFFELRSEYTPERR